MTPEQIEIQKQVIADIRANGRPTNTELDAAQDAVFEDQEAWCNLRLRDPRMICACLGGEFPCVQMEMGRIGEREAQREFERMVADDSLRIAMNERMNDQLRRFRGDFHLSREHLLDMAERSRLHLETKGQELPIHSPDVVAEAEVAYRLKWPSAAEVGCG